MPLAHDPGHAQVDFGEAWVVIAGVRGKVHYFALDLAHSDACFVKAYPAQTTEAFCDGHVAAFGFFGGAPLSILYDNTTLAVAKFTNQVQHWYAPELRWASPGVMDQVRCWVLANWPHVYPEIYRVLAEGDAEITGPIHDIRCPTLVMTGAEDSATRRT